MKGYPTSYAGCFGSARMRRRYRAHRDPADPAGLRPGSPQRRASTTSATTSSTSCTRPLSAAIRSASTSSTARSRTGTFEPLDGQQRLTTLFLLHWYLASRSGRLGDPQAWTSFTYATRPSARLFCERLVGNLRPRTRRGRRRRGSRTSRGTSTSGATTRRSSRCSSCSTRSTSEFGDDDARRGVGAAD